MNMTMDLNLTTAPDEEIQLPFLHTEPYAYIVPILFGLIFIVGTVGNGTLIYTVLANKKMRNAPNIFIVSLAVGDLLLIIISIPFSATYYTFISWPYGEAICKVNEFLQTLSLGVSVFTLTALAGDRYTAIVYPMKTHRGSAKMRTLMIAISIWVLSFVLALPEAVAALVVVHGNGRRFCSIYPDSWGEIYGKAHVLFRFVVYFSLPLVIIGVFYLLMARILVRSSQNMPGECQAHRQLQARKKVAQIVLSFVVIFFLCWFPRHIYLMWYHFSPDQFNMFWMVFKILGFCLSFMNSCINPVALYFLSNQFRRYYHRYLFCGWACKYQGPGVPHRQGEHTEGSNTTTMYNFNSGTDNRRLTNISTMYTSNTNCWLNSDGKTPAAINITWMWHTFMLQHCNDIFQEQRSFYNHSRTFNNEWLKIVVKDSGC